LEDRLDASLPSAISLLFAGLLVGVLLSAPLMARWRASTVVIAGAALQAAALLWLAAAGSVAAVLTVAACAGIGFGLAEAAGSVAAKLLSNGSATRTLAMLTATVAVVAAISPIAVALIPAGVWLVPVLVSALHLVACGTLAGRDDEAAAAHASQAGTSPEDGVPIWTRSARRVFIIAGVALALYVGVETVFAGWSALIPAAVLDIDAQTAALGTSGFWLCMAAGRFLASFLLRAGVQPGALLATCMGVAALALFLASSLGESALVLVGLGIAVVAMAPVYSLVLGEALDRLSSRAAARATGPLVACGALGGAMIPAALVTAGLQPDSVATFLIAGVVCVTIGCGALAALLIQSRSPSPTSKHQGVAP
jgi:hypothetical protein